MDRLKDNKSLLRTTRPIGLPNEVQDTIRQLVAMACQNVGSASNGFRLAALFDLLVSCQYYNSIANKGWTYCPHSPQKLIYTYTNVCPRCLGNHEFVFTKANKPESGQIGAATSEILCAMLVAYFGMCNRNIEIYRAIEPIDVIIHATDIGMMIIAEVKASPLFTIPLSIACDELKENINGELVEVGHNLCDNPFIRKSQPSLFFPTTDSFKEATFQLTIDWDKPFPFYSAVLGLCESNPIFLDFYFRFWEEAFVAYRDKARGNPVFWLTNACGSPMPRPDNWPKLRSGGYESISDSKTSVGMDRTDDIKKGIYQVLKLGSQYKPEYANIKTALISNLHAIRHQEEYLDCVKDIIWTIDESRSIRRWSQIDPNVPLYNLFDGIISFTQSDIRDADIKYLFTF